MNKFFNLSHPTGTVAAVALSIISLLGLILTAVVSLGPQTIATALDFHNNPLGAIAAICAILVAALSAVKAGAGRSFVPPIDGITTVEVPIHSTVNVTPNSNGSAAPTATI